MKYPSMKDLEYFYTQFRNDLDVENLRGVNGKSWKVTRLDSKPVSNRGYNTMNKPETVYHPFSTYSKMISIYTPEDPNEETLYIFRRDHAYCLFQFIPITLNINDEYFVLAVESIDD